MSKKCEWKDGKFDPCKKFDGRFLERDLPDNKDNPNYCLYCKADIRKPEPEQPIIKKSGDTWVARSFNTDLFCIDPNSKDPEKQISSVDGELTYNRGVWREISEIEITDEIAKLRPMVIVYNNYKWKLYGVDSNTAVFQGESSDIYVKSIRLATISDLED